MQIPKIVLFFIVCAVLFVQFGLAHAQENKDSAFWYNRALDYEEKGDYENAIECYTKAIDLCPDPTCLSSNYLHRGTCNFDSGRYDQAIKDYSKAVELNPNSDTGYVGRGNVYLFLNEYDKALINYTNAIESGQKDYSGFYAFYLRSRAYYEKGEYDKALDDINYSLKLKPDQIYILWVRSDIYREMGRYKEAMADIEKSISIAPDFYRFYFTRGKINESLGENEKALEDYRRGCDLGIEDLVRNRPTAFGKKAIEDVCDACERLRKELGK
ncbi:MAG: tetratricopeptide repeat protein [Deltaproteobacteria bacterium]|nr:tetratricopeptide repeat protein [Candidatus Zymogenaceae bacterium]